MLGHHERPSVLQVRSKEPQLKLSTVFYYCYVLWPAVAWFLNRYALPRKLHWFALYIATVLVGYIAMLLAVQLIEHELNTELYRHDLNGDGSFTAGEMTAEAKRAMNAVTNDTGRTLAPITGGPMTAIWVLINFLPLALVTYVTEFVWRTCITRNVQRHHDIDLKTQPNRVYPANPYDPPRSCIGSDMEATNQMMDPSPQTRVTW